MPVALKLRNGVVVGGNEGTAEFFDCQALVAKLAMNQCAFGVVIFPRGVLGDMCNGRLLPEQQDRWQQPGKNPFFVLVKHSLS